MFTKEREKHIFEKINAFYGYLERMMWKIKNEYPILDKEDTIKQEKLEQALENFMNTFEKEVLNLKEKDVSFKEWKEFFKQYVDSYQMLETEYPILEAFKQSIMPVFSSSMGTGAISWSAAEFWKLY